jgi:signal transduction histidine kinase/DNA-binding response OmpR family regulator
MSSRRTNVLVVDDQVENLHILSSILQDNGYKVRKATNGKMALATIRTQLPDIVLLDIRMPQMDGYEVCSAIKNSPQTCEVPIIFISALDEANNKVRAFEAGGADYITKPFQNQEVLARIKHQLMIRQFHQKLAEQNQRLRQQVQERQILEAMLDRSRAIKRQNAKLERLIRTRTLELQQALEFEATLKQITDHVRDSLDEEQILHTAVTKLTETLQAQCCDTLLFTSALTPVVICAQALSHLPMTHQPITALEDTPLFAQQLQQGWSFAFCPIGDDPSTEATAILACPMYDHEAMVGSLWLFKPALSSFSRQEMRLMQQVANQCAISLRQAQLYQAAQAQIHELQRLNQLKETFLHSVSHELRTPMTTISMVLELLALITNQGQEFLAQVAEPDGANNLVVKYFKLLQEECDREIQLIQGLLDLQDLEARSRSLQLTWLNLYDWLPDVVVTFEPQIQQQQQQLVVQIASGLPELMTDPDSLYRILAELLRNACKFTPARERITLQVFMQANFMHFYVCNSGVEITEAELPYIFDKFYRIPSYDLWNLGGTGLGLALVKKLVEHLCGSIAVTSANRLTQFVVKLPVVLGSSIAESAARS